MSNTLTQCLYTIEIGTWKLKSYVFRKYVFPNDYFSEDNLTNANIPNQLIETVIHAVPPSDCFGHKTLEWYPRVLFH